MTREEQPRIVCIVNDPEYRRLGAMRNENCGCGVISTAAGRNECEAETQKELVGTAAQPPLCNSAPPIRFYKSVLLY